MDPIEEAVRYAFDPQTDPALKAQAHKYLEEVKNSNDGWQQSIELFMKEPKTSPEARFFSLQVLENTLKNRFEALDNNQISYIEQTMMSYLSREFVDNTTTRPGEEFIRNKTAQLFALLFLHVYPTLWPNFFKDMIAVAKTPSDTPSHEKAADFFLRVCISIDEEIARVDIPRTREEVIRNNAIKDTMRMGDTELLISSWFELLQEFKSQESAIAQLALKNIGSYISWIDIQLVMNDQVMSVLYDLLGNANLRTTACECLADIISKGMLPKDKLAMLTTLNITAVLGGLDLSNSNFVECVARLVNVLGTELCKIFSETSLSVKEKEDAWKLIEQSTPYLLKFLADESDDTSSAVFPFVNDMLYIFKRKKKQNEALFEEHHNFLAQLLNVILVKLRYDNETEWDADEDEPEEEAMFQEMRKNLRIFAEHIATINEELFIGILSEFISNTFKEYKKGTELNWRDIELCLYVLFCYGEALPKGAMVFVNANDQLSPLGELVSEMVSCNISAYPHPSAAMQYHENITRYHQFFEHRLDKLPSALFAFVDTRGLHHNLKQIRTRCWYLFQRFIKNLKHRMAPYVENILSSIGDLLTIQVEPVVEQNNMEGIPIPAASTFDSQLYLFETVGLLISMESIEPSKQTEYLRIVLEPLVEGIQKSLQVFNDDEMFLLQLHHYITAIGSVAKGFPASNNPNNSNSNDNNLEQKKPWSVMFVQATEYILYALQSYNGMFVIREAIRYTFSRMITCLGTEVLPYLPNLINGLLTKCQVAELVDFLPFIGLIAHKYKPMIEPIIDELLFPLANRVIDFLYTTPSGTDEALLLLGLRKAYLNFIVSLFNSGLEKVFVSERNLEHLNTILQTFLYFCENNSDPTTQKMSFGVFLKMVKSWASVTVDGTGIHTGTNVSVFDRFIYEQLLPITFTVPLSASFNLADGQSILVFGEITGIQKEMWLRQGVNFIENMNSIVFKAIGFPPERAEEYSQAIQQEDAKRFKKYFQTFITEAKAT